MLNNDCSSHRLVGKFFPEFNPPSLKETEQSLRKQWVLSDDMTIQKLSDIDTFLFQFRQKKDKEYVLKDGPYYVNGVIIVIKDLNTSDIIDFTVASFLVAVVGLPLYLYNTEFLRTLRPLVSNNNTSFSGKFDANSYNIYFQVDVDLKKPLEPGFYVDQNQNRFVEFKYKNLGDFCYNCGIIGHVKKNCNKVKFPKERALNDTSRTQVYGPWLRLSNFNESFYQIVMMQPDNDVGEFKKSLLYHQFFIEVEFNRHYICNITLDIESKSTHRFRFPCSYLDIETESKEFGTTSKAYEVIRNEIYENTPFSLVGLERKSLNTPDIFERIVDQLKLIKKDECCPDDKWLTLTLQINKRNVLTPVDYETMRAMNRERLVEGKILSLIKKRVEKNENLINLSSWEDQIREAISEMGFSRYMHHSYVPRRATQARIEAVQMEISWRICTVPADKSTVSELERFKVLGPDMDRLDPCVICADEMFLAEEATLLPCSHIFHSSCINKWFQVGHKCPLCGFKLPSQK